jgi:hypothetical protein
METTIKIARVPFEEDASLLPELPLDCKSLRTFKVPS